jgi:hypothetical protein
MKNSFLLAALLISCNLFSQSGNRALYEMRWPAGTEKSIDGNSIKRIEGENRNSGVFHGITNISYMKTDQVIDVLRNHYENQLLPSDEIDTRLAAASEEFTGGLITLYVARSSIGMANLNRFLVVFRDLEENELHRYDLDSKIPNRPGSNRLWTNVSSIQIPFEVNDAFYVYVVDKLSSENSRFKFLVTPGN